LAVNDRLARFTGVPLRDDTEVLKNGRRWGVENVPIVEVVVEEQKFATGRIFRCGGQPSSLSLSAIWDFSST